jgi:hypothetical protein
VVKSGASYLQGSTLLKVKLLAKECCVNGKTTELKKQIICINWGDKYGPRYINRLYGMVARNCAPPFSFYCFTDKADGIRPEVKVRALPPIRVPMPTDSRGIWPKSRLWGSQLAELSGPVLYMDLDLLILKSIDPFFSYGNEGDVILARNLNTPFERLGQTSLFRFPVGSLLPLQEKFERDPQGIADKYEFEQRFVTREAPHGVKFFPLLWVGHFKLMCIPPFPFNYLFPPRKPRLPKVLIFPGGLNQDLASQGRWSSDYSYWGPWGHMKKTFSPNRPGLSKLEFIRHFLRPSNWIREVWID